MLPIKLPCILVATLCMHITNTAPSTSSKSEQIASRGFLERFLIGLRDGMGLIKGVFWTVGIAEAAAIIANKYPGTTISERILPMLMSRAGQVERLRLTPASTAGLVLIAVGTALRLRCYRAMKGFFTFDLSIRQGHKLVTKGPYSIVRHPSYSGLILVYSGMFCWYGSQGSWIQESGIMDNVVGKSLVGAFAVCMVSLVAGLLKRMPREDAVLKEAFGQEWVDWSRKVPYFVIPWVY